MPHIEDLSSLFPSDIENSFEENELSFLALTTKVEGILRDKIAWLLNLKIGEDCLLIREWTGSNKMRHDLVILNNYTQEIESIIEFKNQLGFVMPNPEYLRGLRKDLLRSARTISQKDEGDLERSEILFVMFGRTLDNTPNGNDPNVEQAVKYLNGALTDCNLLQTQPIIFQEQFNLFENHWEGWLNEGNLPPDRRLWVEPINGGSFLDIGIKIITSIIGPYSAQEIIDLNNSYWHLP